MGVPTLKERGSSGHSRIVGLEGVSGVLSDDVGKEPILNHKARRWGRFDFGGGGVDPCHDDIRFGGPGVHVDGECSCAVLETSEFLFSKGMVMRVEGSCSGMSC